MYVYIYIYRDIYIYRAFPKIWPSIGLTIPREKERAWPATPRLRWAVVATSLHPIDLSLTGAVEVSVSESHGGTPMLVNVG